MNCFTVYSRIYKYDKHDNIVYLKRGHYCILEQPSWYGNAERGLARYLHGDLGKKVDYIRYEVSISGYMSFSVQLKCDENDMISYREENMTVKEAICRYISGQISDGWGENGIYILDCENGKIKTMECTYQLYELDYKAIDEEIRKNHGKKFFFREIEESPIFKEIEYKY